eukprot:14471-Eustigmatos_ZCMA.PRE.1
MLGTQQQLKSSCGLVPFVLFVHAYAQITAAGGSLATRCSSSRRHRESTGASSILSFQLTSVQTRRLPWAHRG